MHLKRLLLESGIFEHTNLGDFLDPRGYTFKRLLLKKLFRANDCDTFVETGASFGETTRYMAKIARLALSCEPQEDLYKFNIAENRHLNNIQIWNAGSESCFPEMLGAAKGPPLFFLDGHYSGTGTSLTEFHSPILRELDWISGAQFERAVVVVDDVRLFGSTQNSLARSFESGYPDLGLTVDKLRSALPGNQLQIMGDCLVSAMAFG
jgi:hypothetical protein